MDKERNINIIENKEVAIDIMFGNTPLDMYYRALKNSSLNEVFIALEEDPHLIELILTNFKKFLSSDHDYTYLGTFIAYLSVFSQSGSPALSSQIAKLTKDIGNDSFLYEVVKKTQDKLNENSGDISDFEDETKYVKGSGLIFGSGSNLVENNKIQVSISNDLFIQNTGTKKRDQTI